MEKTSIIKDVFFANPTQGNKGDTLYYHKVELQNGETGKISQCTEAAPEWLKPGLGLTYISKEGRFGDSDGRFRNLFTRVIPNINGNSAQSKSNWGNRLDDNPDFRQLQQKFISMAGCLTRANDLVIAGKIPLKNKYKVALEEFNFMLNHLNNNDTHEE